MSEFIPHEMLIKAQKVKLKFLAIPGIVIVICFFLRGALPEVKYITIFALVVYFIILFAFRFKRAFIKAEINEVVAPLNGRIIDKRSVATGNVLTIQKPFFASAEVVTCTASDLPNVLDLEKNQVSWRIENANLKIFIKETVEYQAVLVGVAPGSALCELFIPAEYELSVEVGDRVEAGVTVLSTRHEA